MTSGIEELNNPKKSTNPCKEKNNPIFGVILTPDWE